MLDFFSDLWLAASLIGCLYLFVAAAGVARFAARRAPRAWHQLPVTILKPLYGEDATLRENLRSFCRQDYPSFQIVFGVADAEDPAVPIVRALVEEFPQADLTLVIDPTQRGANLKVANLRNMLPAARYDLLVMADSDMRVAPDYLTAVTAPLVVPPSAGSETGLVTCLYRGISAGGLCSDLAALHINHGFLPQAVLADSRGLGAGCFGATMALRRATLEAVGGFDALADTLADDYMLGQAVRRLGLGVALSPHLIDDIVAEPGFAALFRHELRWARTVRLAAPWGYLGSIVTYPVPLALIGWLLGARPVAAAILLLALFCRAWSARRLDHALGLRPASLWLLPLRDLLSFAVFAASFLGRSVAWRDRKFRVSPSGQLSIDGESPV